MIVKPGLNYNINSIKYFQGLVDPIWHDFVIKYAHFKCHFAVPGSLITSIINFSFANHFIINIFLAYLVLFFLNLLSIAKRAAATRPTLSQNTNVFLHFGKTVLQQTANKILTDYVRTALLNRLSVYYFSKITLV